MPNERMEKPSCFISTELRPQVGTTMDEYPPLPVESSNQQLQQRIDEVLGATLRRRLGLAGPGAALPAAEQVYRRSNEVVYTPVEGEMVLLDLRDGLYYSLNRVGAAVWELLGEQRTLGDVHGAICRRFDVAPAAAWDDLASLVHHLRREKLVEMETNDAVV